MVLAASFLTGAAAALVLASPMLLLPVLIAAALALAVIPFVKRIGVRCAVIAIAFLFLGAGYTTARYHAEFRSPITAHAGGIDQYEAVIKSYEGLNLTRHSHLASVRRVWISNDVAEAAGTIRLYSTAEEPFVAGDTLIIRRPILLYRELFAVSNRAIADILEKRRIFGVSSVYRRADYHIVSRASPIATAAQRAAFAARAYIKRSLGAVTSGQTYAITQCFILGDKSPISQDIMSDFQRAGTMHILSVSGLHFSMVIAIIVLLAGFLPINSFARVTIAVVATVIVYSPMTLYVPPVMRSAVMALFLVPVMLFDRTRNLPNVLFLTLFALVIISPKDIGDISFLLSFMATASLVLIIPPADALIRSRARFMQHSVMRYLSGAVLTSVTAVIFTAPLTMHYFGTVNFTSIVSNMVAVPISFVMLSLAFLVAATAMLPVIPVWYGAALNTATELFIAVNRFFADIPLRIDGVSMPFWAAIVLSAALIAVGMTVSVLLQKRTSGSAMEDITNRIFPFPS